jgi:hypothetical protein
MCHLDDGFGGGELASERRWSAVDRADQGSDTGDDARRRGGRLRLRAPLSRRTELRVVARYP